MLAQWIENSFAAGPQTFFVRFKAGSKNSKVVESKRCCSLNSVLFRRPVVSSLSTGFSLGSFLDLTSHSIANFPVHIFYKLAILNLYVYLFSCKCMLSRNLMAYHDEQCPPVHSFRPNSILVFGFIEKYFTLL